MAAMTIGPLSERERLDWLRLARSENVGPITFRRLLERYGSAAAALDALPDLARRGGRTGTLRIATKAQAEKEIDACRRVGAQLLGLGEPAYPARLRALDDAPPLLCVRGHAALLDRATVAVVGARNASLAGRKLAAMIAAGLGAAGITVVSGLARGIDAAAHEAA